MTFQELLTHNRGPEWVPPHKLVALDPGETTGYATFIDGKPSFAGQINTKDNYNELMREIMHFNPTFLVYEDYKIYPNKVNMHTLSNIPTVKLIGVIEYECGKNNIKAFKMLASTAKGFVTSDKLKDWGFYKSNRRHGMDSLRVGLHFLLFEKGI